MPRHFAALALAFSLSLLPASHGFAQESMNGDNEMATSTEQMDPVDSGMSMEQMPADGMSSMDDTMMPTDSMDPMMP
jgi:hypothetical protein